MLLKFFIQANTLLIRKTNVYISIANLSSIINLYSIKNLNKTNFNTLFSQRRYIATTIMPLEVLTPIYNKEGVDYFIRAQFECIYSKLKNGEDFELTKKEAGKLTSVELSKFVGILLAFKLKFPNYSLQYVFLPILRYMIEISDAFDLDKTKLTYAQIASKFATNNIEKSSALHHLEVMEAEHCVKARHQLALVHYEGIITPVNYPAALTYLEQNVRHGFVKSIELLAIMTRDGKGITANAEIAFTLFQTIAFRDHAFGWLHLARCYKFGSGTEKNERKEFYCYKKAADLGDMVGHHNAACGYLAGKGIKPSVKLAFKHFKFAAELGFNLSQINLGNMYLNGYGVKVDLQQAEFWYTKASVNNKDALSLLKAVAEEKEKLKLSNNENSNDSSTT